MCFPEYQIIQKLDISSAMQEVPVNMNHLFPHGVKYLNTVALKHARAGDLIWKNSAYLALRKGLITCTSAAWFIILVNKRFQMHQMLTCLRSYFRLSTNIVFCFFLGFYLLFWGVGGGVLSQSKDAMVDFGALVPCTSIPLNCTGTN